MSFELHPRHAAGTIKLGQSQNCQILIKNNSYYPWFLIIPKVDEHIIDLHQLDLVTYQHICELQYQLSAFVKSEFNCYKVNTACIGNVVEQLHIHIVGRNQGLAHDPAWPAPVWGHDAKQAYTNAEIVSIQQTFKQAFQDILSTI